LKLVEIVPTILFNKGSKIVDIYYSANKTAKQITASTNVMVLVFEIKKPTIITNAVWCYGHKQIVQGAPTFVTGAVMNETNYEAYIDIHNLKKIHNAGNTHNSLVFNGCELDVKGLAISPGIYHVVLPHDNVVNETYLYQMLGYEL